MLLRSGALTLGHLLLECGHQLVEKDAQLMKQEEETAMYAARLENVGQSADALQRLADGRLRYLENLTDELNSAQKELKEVKAHRDWLDAEMRKVCHVLTGFDSYQSYDMIGVALDAKQDTRLMDWLEENHTSRQNGTFLSVITSASVGLRRAVKHAMPSDCQLVENHESVSNSEAVQEIASPE